MPGVLPSSRPPRSASPTAGGASYAAAKAAAEAWTLAVADGFRRAQSGSPRPRNKPPVEQHSAAVIFVVKALVDEAMRAASPERKFPGLHRRRASWRRPSSGSSGPLPRN